ncbi:MAG: TlpA disulfide reductase family protein [Eubacteriales bacterium]
MKKFLILSFTLLLALSVSCAQAKPEDFIGRTVPDFTVKTLSGESFTLSESLKTHDLVVINFWATWCGPCCYEFPFLEKAWEQYSDRVDVLALNVWDERSSDDLLRRFVQEYGLGFSVSRDTMQFLDGMDPEGIPTTLFIDANRCIVHVKAGVSTSTEAFTDLFDSLLPPAAETSDL